MKKVSSIYFMQEEEAPDYFTCCRVLGGVVVAGGRDGVVRVYK